MKKMKMFLMTAAVLIAFGFAYASKPKDLCWGYPEYWYDGTYHDAGEIGVDYACWNMPGTCTYYWSNYPEFPRQYAPCRSGVIQLFGLAEKKESKSSH